jgi:leucyl/phenylalanyl-tRNA---protein transferase
MRGDELTPWLIRYAYAQGAFPMTMDDGTVEWFQPHVRALFPIEGVHLSRSMEKALRRRGFTITFDAAFEDVMRSCLRPGDNWISEDFIRAYTQIHHEGWAHSVEVWSDEEPGAQTVKRGGLGYLVGGLYGLALGACFCGESMFHRTTNGSKVALWAMVNKCRELGFTIFDAQVMNPHLLSMGAYPISHEDYMQKLHVALAIKTAWSLDLANTHF